MTAKKRPSSASGTKPLGEVKGDRPIGDLSQYECGPLQFRGNDYYDRHVVFDHVVPIAEATPRQHFEAVSRTLRDLLSQRWLKTRETYRRENPKRVYYLSMEFLIGRTLANNVMNLGVEEFVRSDLASGGQDWRRLAELEPDAGLGNGGLGRLAACFLDSMATLGLPAIGYGLRYEYGIFRQQIHDGFQVEQPDRWLDQPDPWEVRRSNEVVRVPFNCGIQQVNGRMRLVDCQPTHLLAIPYDRAIVGYGGRTINTLRLWSASAPHTFRFDEFSSGDFIGAVIDRILAETITRVLYPDDSTLAGQVLRFLQEYFLVCSSIADIITRFQSANREWKLLPDKVAIQLNDTHPSLAVAELMRILLDRARLGWDEAWDLTVRTLAYTNHTLLPEALERWPVRVFETVCPRLLEIVYEINRRFLDGVRAKYPGDDARVQRMSLIEEAQEKQVRMAHLAVVGSHKTNGVAAIHSQLLRANLMRDFAELYPERFTNKTNGVTPRRWLKLCNPPLAKLISSSIGEGWVTDLARLRGLLPFAEDSKFRDAFRAAKRQAKTSFADWLKSTHGTIVDPDSLFDCQVKRIHEYKRQLLNILHVVILYNRLRTDPKYDCIPRTVFFAGKAAPAYHFAKLVIRLINGVADVVDADPAVRGRLKVLFLPEYCVSLAERIIPAADLSEQISTAGYEASGTSNMKFMMNGALTIGTRDGATIEMAEEAGEDNLFLFGLTAEQVAESRGWYDPHWHYEHEPETRAALDMIFNGYFSRNDANLFAPIRDALLTRGDYYRHLADMKDYASAQARVETLARDPNAWSRKAIINVACSGKFSSDRTIAEYAADIWNAEPCPVA